MGFPRSFGEKTAGRSGFGTTFWWFFSGGVSVLFGKTDGRSGEIPCPSGKEQFQWQSKSEWEYRRRNRAKNMGMYWVCLNIVGFTPFLDEPKWRENWFGEILEKDPTEKNWSQSAAEKPWYLRGTYGWQNMKAPVCKKKSCQQLTEETAVGTYREFVIFDDECVYPEYMLLYDRVM